MSGFAVEKASSAEVVAAWTVPQSVVTAVNSAPGWGSIGEYYLPKSVTARLDLVGLVSADDLTLHMRLWDVTAAALSNGAMSTSSRSPRSEERRVAKECRIYSTRIS